MRWLSPKQEKAVEAKSAVVPTQYAEPTPAARPGETRSQAAASPLDAFGDSSEVAARAEPATEPPAIPKERKPIRPKPGKSPAANPPKRSPYYSPEGLLPSVQEPGSRGKEQFRETCPSPKDLKKISELSTNIAPPEGDLPHDCPLGSDVFQPRSFSPITYTWTASSLCHNPLYFEDAQLERYGHMWGPWLQPFMSAGNFFVKVPFLPYEMGLEPPGECVYALGYYRPGNCAPYMIDAIPLSVRAALFEGAAIVGIGYAFP
ncbi:MAG: hypothetical protein LLG00_15090 [Planctomycetaceae bacterium]|nr:hypothetical protein [Planctomycetaceae bacterium]